MDTLIRRPNSVEADRASIAGELTRIAAEPTWIVEGWIDDYSSDLLDAADHIIDLDFPVWLAALGGVERWWRHRRARRPELPAGCTEKWHATSRRCCCAANDIISNQMLGGRRVTKLRSRRAANRIAVVPRANDNKAV